MHCALKHTHSVTQTDAVSHTHARSMCVSVCSWVCAYICACAYVCTGLCLISVCVCVSVCLSVYLSVFCVYVYHMEGNFGGVKTLANLANDHKFTQASLAKIPCLILNNIMNIQSLFCQL